ncbi:MAG: alpha/beta hydrolase [Dehalococcoidia bacterium]|nr:alpha/beta hydrolase [Dehalococcoidia bacterium]
MRSRDPACPCFSFTACALDPVGGSQLVGELKPKIDQAMAAGGPRAATDAFFDFLCPGLWRSLPEDLRHHYRDNSAELLGDLGMPQYQISREDLAEIRTPCLMISGSDSYPALRSIARIVAENIPGCKFTELSGSGHVTYYERPAEFAAFVKSFAEALETNDTLNIGLSITPSIS